MNTLLVSLFEDAVENIENRDPDGYISWDFVSADIIIGLKEAGYPLKPKFSNQIQSVIDEMIDEYLEETL
jgi:hypothetical protein